MSSKQAKINVYLLLPLNLLLFPFLMKFKFERQTIYYALTKFSMSFLFFLAGVVNKQNYSRRLGLFLYMVADMLIIKDLVSASLTFSLGHYFIVRSNRSRFPVSKLVSAAILPAPIIILMRLFSNLSINQCLGLYIYVSTVSFPVINFVNVDKLDVLGAFLFFISDNCLVINKFVQQMELLQVFYLGTYYLGCNVYAMNAVKCKKVEEGTSK
ncbi:YhhN-like [Hexamita inflata]|uniref:YhhN-like n=1 Tax=Hexamita inflata TaxID=28002 RepID=A0AA86PS52_9EUKA|nr:YhhN-like [Hexamita inflata]